MARADMNEMNVQSVDHRNELWERIQLCLYLTPVVVLTPVAHEILEFRQLHSLGLIRDCLALGPARRQQALTKVDQVFLGDVNTKRADRDRMIRGRKRWI